MSSVVCYSRCFVITYNEEIIKNKSPAEIEGMPPDAGTRDVRGTSFLEYGARFGGDWYAAPG